jgi:preprotein translocase subunit SecD
VREEGARPLGLQLDRHRLWRAMSAIIDANLTTLIAAVLLFGFGSGPIRGFATTLSLGLLTSMFSSTIFTRMLLAIWVRWRRPTELVI